MKQTKNKILFLIGTLALAFVTFSCTPEVGQSTPTPTPSTDKCSVSYSSEHGTAPVTISVDKDTILSAEQLPELSDDGFTFDAWYDGDVKAVAGKYKVTKDVNLTAKWTARNITLTFKANGGTGNDCTQTVTYGTTVYLNANTFTREGYAFKGWNTKADGSGTYYSDTASFTPTGNSDLELYAQWHSFAGKVYSRNENNYMYFSEQSNVAGVYYDNYNGANRWVKDYSGTYSSNSMTLLYNGGDDPVTYQIKFMHDKILYYSEAYKAIKQSGGTGFPGEWVLNGAACNFYEDGTCCYAAGYTYSYSIDKDGIVTVTIRSTNEGVEYTNYTYLYFDGTFLYSMDILEEVTDSEIISNVINAAQ